MAGMSDVVIRPVTADDRAAWEPLWDGYNAFYERSGPTAVSTEQTDLTWARFLDDAEPMHALVAEDPATGGLVGLTHFLFHRSTTMIQPTCYLQDLFTAPAARGRGAGRALIEAVYAAAAAAGSTRVYWLTHETNATARSLYDRVAELSGFVQYRHDV